MLSGHGDDQYNYTEKLINFSSNVRFDIETEEIRNYLFSRWHTVCSYPDPIATPIGAALSSLYNLPQECFLAGNGSTELFYLIAAAFPRTRSVIVIPAFAEYEDACRAANHRIRFITRNDSLATYLDDTDLCWIGNPNNPDGACWSIDEIQSIIACYPRVVFVIDEAYKEFCEEFHSSICLVRQMPNLIVVHSLTKSCGLPGLRMGYLCTDPRWVKKLRTCKIPWSMNALAIEAALFILQHPEKYLTVPQSYLQNARTLAHALSLLDGIETIPSKTHYFLARLAQGTAGHIKEFLIEHHGVLIRDASNFRGLNERYIRIAARSADDNAVLIQGLGAWLNHHS